MDNSNICVVVVADEICIVKSQVEKKLWLRQWTQFCESSFLVESVIRNKCRTVEIEAGIFNAVIGRSQGVVDIASKAPTLNTGNLDASVKLILQMRRKSRRQPLSEECTSSEKGLEEQNLFFYHLKS